LPDDDLVDVALLLTGAVAAALGAALLVAAARRTSARARGTPVAHVSVVALLLLSLDWSDGDWPAWQVAAVFVGWVVVLATFPDGHAEPRWMLWFVSAYVALAVVRVGTGGDFESSTWAPLLLAGVAVAGGAQIWRYRRRASVIERESTRWLVLGLVLTVTLLLAAQLTGLADAPAPGTWWWEASRAVGLILPASAALGLLLPSQLSVDPLVEWATVTCASAITLLTIYVVTNPALGAGWAAALTAAAAAPLTFGFRRLAERLVYGAEAGPALTRLGRRLEDSLGPDDVAQTVAEAVREGLGIPYAAVDLTRGPTAEAGVRRGDLVLEAFPVDYQGSQVATILATPRAGEARLTRRDALVLERLARRTGAALHGAGVVGELRTARERLVRTREEERRRVRRDLHDDLAPTLAGLGMSAAAISSLIDSDPERARRLSSEITGGIRRASRQVREIAYDLHPADLDRLGLVETLRERIVRHGPDTPVITLQAPEGDLMLAAAVETAALRIVQEAVTNTRRHSGATHCSVSISRVDGHLDIEVADDGNGLTPGTRPGMGLRAIEERTEEIGGRCELISSPSGTTVRVSLPTSEGSDDQSPSR
jgi:signal transduction histidine kinase